MKANRTEHRKCEEVDTEQVAGEVEAMRKGRQIVSVDRAIRRHRRSGVLYKQSYHTHPQDSC